MTHSTAGVTGTTTLLFQAPPAPPREDAPATAVRPKRPAGSGRSGTAGHGPLRMLKGARAAASGMRISEDEIRAVLEDPHDVQPDPKQPSRTRLHRDGLVVTTGNDGMILRVAKGR